MKKMMCALVLVALTSVFGGCNVPSEETVPLDTSTPDTSSAVIQNTISESGLYTNNDYGYELQLPKIEGETYESIVNSGGIYLGGEANLLISIYSKDDQRYKDIVQDDAFKTVKINDYDVLQKSAIGSANFWFIVAVFSGSQYAYEFEFSNDTKDQKAIDMQDGILKSFKLL